MIQVVFKIILLASEKQYPLFFTTWMGLPPTKRARLQSGGVKKTIWQLYLVYHIRSQFFEDPKYNQMPLYTKSTLTLEYLMGSGDWSCRRSKSPWEHQLSSWRGCELCQLMDHLRCSSCRVGILVQCVRGQSQGWGPYLDRLSITKNEAFFKLKGLVSLVSRVWIDGARNLA